MARIVPALDVKVLIGRLASINVGEVVFGLHHMRSIERAFDSGDLLETFVVVKFRIRVELMSELSKHGYVKMYAINSRSKRV